MSRLHIERHVVDRIGWLRAAVLGANDGTVSTASLIVGIGAKAGGAPGVPAVVRVTFWGALAMVVTALIGSLFGAPVA